MQITPHIDDIKMTFRLEVGPGKTVERFVYLWLIYGRQISLVDSGVAGARELIFDAIKEVGRKPSEISTLVITHAHPDHVGGALGVQKATGCDVAAHTADRPWIEDTELQFRERPVPGFHKIVEGPVKVGRTLADGDSLDLVGGNVLKVLHTPGHSRGHISLLYEAEKALFSGDCIPVPGDMPIYEDVIATVKSVKRLRGVGGLQVLLSSWDLPRRGPEIYEAMDEALAFIQDVHKVVREAKTELGNAPMPEIARLVCQKLGLPEMAMNPLFFRTVEAHLRVSDHADLLTL
jgi:hydroxyacylglutathione hydrolase